MIKKKILLGIATGILFIQSISLKADQYVDLGLSPKNIPDTLLINTQNALDVQLTLHDGTPLRASLYFHISLSADSSNNGLVNFAEEHFFLMDIGYENDVLLNATPKNFLEGNYFISVSYSWGTAGFVDTIPQNNHFFKSIYLKKAEHLSFPANNPLTIIPSDTIYNHQTIKVYDTLDLFNNSQAPREITINYLLTKGLDQKHYETQTIKSMDYVLNPYNNTLFIEFETTLPSDIAAGDLYLASYSEDYNYISSKKIVGAYQEPDIDVSSLQLLNDTFSCNGAIMFEYTIHNPWNLKLNWDRINGYFSKDSVLDKDFDHDLPAISGKTAKPKSDSTFTQGIQVQYMEPGDYYFFIEVSDYFLYENDKSNNIARFQVTLNNDPVDWELTSVEIPDTVCLGQTFTSTLNIQHTTPSLIGQSLYYYMYFSKDSIYDSFDPKIDHSGLYHSSSVDYDYPQNNYSVKLQSTAFADAPGAHYLAYSIDIPHGVSVETTKENNHLVKNIYFKPSKTNLTITEVTRYPESMNTNDYKTIDFTIENNGAFTTNDVYVIAYLSSDSSYSKDDIFLRGYHFDTLGQAPAKGSISFGLPDYLQDTTYSIILVADPENKIIESNESDNQFAVDIDITNMDGYNGMPDLMPIYSYEYDTISIPFDFVEFLDYRYIPYINFNITNKGDVDLNEYPRYKAYISEDKVLDDLDLSSRYLNNIGSIAKGDTVNRFHNLAILDQIDEPGLYYLFIVMDQDNKIPEKDETNNTLGPIPFNYFPGNSEIFDAGYTNMELSDTIIQAGEDLTITLDIKNFGNHTIQSLSGSYIYIDADTTSEFDAYYQEYLSFGSIEPDSTLTVSETTTIEADFPPGEYFIYAYRKPAIQYPEYDNTNDRFYKKITIIDTIGLAPPNLKALQITIDTNRIFPLQTFSYTALVVNNGGKDFSAYEQSMNIYFSDDKLIDGLDKRWRTYNSWPGIAAGDTLKIESTFKPAYHARDTHYIIMKIDISDKIDESDENDNILIVPIYINGLDVQPPVIKSPEFILCGKSSIDIMMEPLEPNETYYWKKESWHSAQTSKDSVYSIYIYNPGDMINVWIDSAGFLSKRDTIDVYMTPFIDPDPEYEYTKLSLSTKIVNFNYKWYHDSVFIGNHEDSYELYYRANYGEGHYFVEFDHGVCHGIVDFGTIKYPEPIGAQNINHCGPGELAFYADSLENNEKYQWYSNDIQYLGTSEQDEIFNHYVVETDTFYVAVDSMNNISDITPFLVTIHYLPSDSLIITNDSIMIADTSENLSIYWMINDKIVDSLTNDRAIPVTMKQHGDISAKIISGKCFAIAEDSTINIQSHVSKHELFIYPNPVSDILHIHNTNETFYPSHISLYNITGERIWNGIMENDKTMLDFSTYKSGMYFIIIEHQTKQYRFKIIKH